MFRKIAVVSSLCTISGLPALAGTFSNDFNGGVPVGTAVYGSAVVEATGGVGNSGALKLTKAVTSLSGGFIIEDIDGGKSIYGFDMRFKARVGGGTATPADGFSMSFGPDLPDGAFSEEGAGSGIRFIFDTYDNGALEAPAIDIAVGGVVVATRKLTIPQISTGSEFVDVRIDLKPSGLLNLFYKDMVIYTNYVVPDHQGIQGRFGFGARTGGATANHFVDDLQITTFLQPQIAISEQPTAIKALQGQDATFTVGVTKTDGVTYQWLRNGTDIGGATFATLTIPDVAPADAGARFSVRLTGPNNTVTSDEVVLSVVDIPGVIAPEISMDFNDGAVPPNGAVGGSAYVSPTGGVNNSGVLVLTEAVESFAGSFVINDPDAGAPVYGLTVQFDARIGGGTALPADGFSFNLSPTIPDPLPAGIEEGVATGLSVTFDIYDNGGGEAPSIDVKYNGAVVASAKVPLSFIQTGDSFGEVLVRLEANGTIDVAFRGAVIHENVLIPGFTSIAGGQYLFGGRTGGAWANQWIDNIRINTVNTPSVLRIAAQPSAQTSLLRRSATFTAAVNDPTGVTFQWLRNGTAIAGATSSTYTLAATAAGDDGARFQLRATKGTDTVTSDEAVLNVVDLAAPALPDVNFTFNDGVLPSGTTNYGVANITPTGGVGDSGVLVLTTAENGQSGGFVIRPLLSGAEVSAISVAFDVLIGGGSAVPADGLSFNFAPDVAEGTVGEAENGSGSGLTIAFDIYDNAGGEAPAIEVKYKGTVLTSTKLSIADISTGDTFRTVLLKVQPDGKLSLAYGDRVIENNLQLPNYTFIANGKFGFYARTGGLNANHWVDDVRIGVTKSAAPLRFTVEPSDVVLLSGKIATFTSSLSDPIGATYQWLRNGAAIPGATSSTYTTAALTAADNGVRISIRAVGPGGTLTSREAILTVVDPILATNPIFSVNFDDGTVPDDTFPIGSSANVDGSLRLTEAVNGLQGGYILANRDGDQAVSAFTANFKIYASDGTSPPADGFSFVWGSDVSTTAAFGEDGAGSGLVVTFDIYDNGGGEAPAIDVSYGGALVAGRKVPLDLLLTEGGWVDVTVRIEADGTLDVHYDGNVIHHNIQLPDFAPVTGGNFGFGARTGGLNLVQGIDDLRIATSTGSVAPTMTIARSGATGVSITWTGGGTLQSRENLNPGGTWTPVTGANSPHTAQTIGSMRFFRVAQ